MDTASGCVDILPPYSTPPTSADTPSAFPPFVTLVPATPERHSIFSLRMRAGLLQVRDAVPSDADAYVNYWHYSGDRIKDSIGVDRKKLGTPEDSRQRFLSIIRLPGAEQANVVFTITLNSKVVGYSNLNRYGPNDNYAHLHTYRSSLRSALKACGTDEDSKTGCGLGGVLIGWIGGYFSLFPINRLILQTRTTNRVINAVLDKYLAPAEMKYVDQPAGLLAPGEMYVRYVYREDALWMRQQAEFLAICDRHQGSARPFWSVQTSTAARPTAV